MWGKCFNFFFCISKTFLHVLSGHENALLFSGGSPSVQYVKLMKSRSAGNRGLPRAEARRRKLRRSTPRQVETRWTHHGGGSENLEARRVQRAGNPGRFYPRNTGHALAAASKSHSVSTHTTGVSGTGSSCMKSLLE